MYGLCAFLLYIRKDTVMKEKKKKRKGLRILIAVLWALLVALVIGYCVTLYADGKDPDGEKGKFTLFAKPDETQKLEEIAESYEEVSYDSKDSVLYINNELIVLAKLDAELSDIEAIAEKYNAEISDIMEDIGVYQLRFSDSKSLKKLESLANDISAEELIEKAYVNPVIIFESEGDETDSDETDEIELPDPVYPDDPWDNVNWNIKVPRGDNWGLEAINAPAAWGFLSELSTSRVGLIDTLPDLDHEDLNVAGAYWSLYDEDSNDWTVYDMTLQDVEPDNHGTHVAGTMGATWNNIGISGILGNNSEIYYSKAYNAKGGNPYAYDTAYTFVKSISVLLEHDVTAINISLNTNRVRGFAASQGDKDAIESLQREADIAGAMLERIVSQRQKSGKSDFVICVAAGNTNGNYFLPDENADYGYKMYSSRKSGALKGGVNGTKYSQAKYNNFLNLISNEEVANRIIVVGAVQIDNDNSTKSSTRYKYTAFSCTGDRVDIAAPGSNIYSCVQNTYDYMNGTSMATPHVTAAAGMLFAANPELTGPEVKKLLVASASGRYYFDNGNCGLLDLATAVGMAIETRDTSVNRVIGTGGGGLDLCFLVDTTGSMEDDIDNAKANMIHILASLAEKTDDYRVAIVDYRDFSDRTSDYRDYPAMTQLKFTSNDDEIINAINSLTLGHGGDVEETVYSGFAEALKLDWRATSSKVIIILGDAPPLDPEPVTGYTYESIVKALYNADIKIDVEDSDDVTIGDAGESLIKIYGIGTEATDSAEEFFDKISSATGGAYKGVDDAASVSDAIVDSIEEIELEPVQSVKLDFGKDFSNETVKLYRGSEYLFSFELDEDGYAKLENMKLDKYKWEISRLHRNGEFKVREGKSKVSVEIDDAPWYSFAYVLWERERTETFVYTGAGLLVLILVLTLTNIILGAVDRSRQSKAETAAAAPVQVQAPAPTVQQPVAPVSEPKKEPTVSEAEKPKKKFCYACGTQLDADAKFCHNCGTHL